MPEVANGRHKTPIFTDHPRRVAFEQALRNYKKKSSYPMRSMAVINTPLPFRKNVYMIHKSLVPQKGNLVRIALIDLKSLTMD